MLSRSFFDQLANIIQRRVTGFFRRLFGRRFAPADAPTASGKDPLPASIVQLSFVLGKTEAVLKEEEWRNVTWEQLEEASGIELTPIERRQVDAAEMAAYSQFRGLAGDIQDGLFTRLSQEMGQAVSEAQVRGIIADKVKFGVLMDQTVRNVANELLGSLKEQKRNWLRVASNEMHTARQLGVARAIIDKVDVYEDSEGIDSNVTVVPAPDACKDCLRLYTEDGQPRIFTLKKLMNNAGSNYERPWRQNARPVLPPLHPHCFCRLQYVPEGFGFDEKGRLTMVEKSKETEILDEMLIKAYAPGAEIPEPAGSSQKRGYRKTAAHALVNWALHQQRGNTTEAKKWEDHAKKLSGLAGVGPTRAMMDAHVKLHSENYRTEPHQHNREYMMAAQSAARHSLVTKSQDDGDLNKAIDHVPHSLLGASMADLPSKAYIYRIAHPEEIRHLLPRLDKLQQMYAHNHELYQRIDDLIHAAYARFDHLVRQDPSLLKEEEEGEEKKE